MNTLELSAKSKDYHDYVNQWNNTGKITMHKERHLCMERHLLSAIYGQKKGYLFYTSSPNKEFNLICLDVDEIESDADYYNVVHYLSSLFPNCYYERSTNGTGLHFYILVQFNSYRTMFAEVNEGVYRNVLYFLLSSSLRSIVNDNFNVKFDAVKGTCPLYDFNNGFLKYGTLVKLPAPVTYEQFKQLYSSSVYSENRILCIINYLNDITCRYSSGIYTTDYLISSLSSVLKDTPIRTTPKDLVSKINEQKETSLVTLPTPLTTITNGGTNGHPEKKIVRNKSKDEYKKYTVSDIMNTGDSRTRESLYIKKYAGDYYSKHGELPSLGLTKDNYRTEMKYHKVGEFREKRFKKYYDHTVDTFDIDKASDGTVPYKIGMYDKAIIHTDPDITQLVHNSDNNSYNRKVYRYDVDITLEYIHICSKNKKNRAREMQIKKYAKQEGITEGEAKVALSNTVPRKGLIGFYKFVQKKHRTVVVGGRMKKINGCDGKKATALLDLVVKLKLAECMVPTSDYGRARKFKLSEAVSQIRESWNDKDTAVKPNKIVRVVA